MKNIKQAAHLAHNPCKNETGSIFLLCILLLFNSCNSHKRSEDENFYLDFFDEYSEFNFCLYGLKSNYEQKEIIDAIISNQGVYREKSKIQLSADEIPFIVNELKMQFNETKKDSLNPLFKKYNDIACETKLSITKPIFIREGQLCIFYFQNHAEGNLLICRKTIFGWKKEKLLYGWIT